VNAFVDYPLHVWTIPDGEERRKKLHTHFSMVLRYGLKFADMYASSESIEGFVIYMHPESGPVTTWRLVQCGGFGFLRVYGSTAIKRYNQAIAPIETLRGKNAPSPHVYVLLLAVDPRAQGKGWARKLITPMLDRLDKNAIACYLETYKAKNEAIYNHLGFETIEKCTVPGTDLTLISLLRRPLA